MREQRVYASRKFCAERNMLNGFVAVRVETADEKRSGWQGYCCYVVVCVSRHGGRGTCTCEVYGVRTASGWDGQGIRVCLSAMGDSRRRRE